MHGMLIGALAGNPKKMFSGYIKDGEVMKQVEFVKCDSGLVLHTAAELHGFTGINRLCSKTVSLASYLNVFSLFTGRSSTRQQCRIIITKRFGPFHPFRILISSNVGKKNSLPQAQMFSQQKGGTRAQRPTRDK